MKELLIALIVAWSSSGAVVSWQQPAGVRQTCLLRYYGAEWPAGVCWRDLLEGEQVVELPGALTHPAYRPTGGDRYVLEMDGQRVGEATLGEARVYTTYLALVAKQNAPPEQRVYVPVVGR